MAMTDEQKKKIVYGGRGLPDEKMEARPLRAEERHAVHTALSATECHDCKNIISREMPFVTSTITITQGLRSQSFTYSIHPECYDILRVLMNIVPVDAAHLWGAGRKPLVDMWTGNKELIRERAPELAEILSNAFRPK